MNSNETVMNNAPTGKSSKKKIIVIAAIAAAVVLLAAIIIIAVVLNNKYLDKMKDYDPVGSTVFNGYEIVNEDGLYYLTKEGKKVSKTGYTMLESVNERYYQGQYNRLDGTYENVKFYDYFVARKQDAETYFLIDGEGKELAIEDEGYTSVGYYLPFVAFLNDATGDYGVISLEALESDISSSNGSSISMNSYDTVYAEAVNKKAATNFYIRLYDETPGANAPKYYYVNTQGSIMFATTDNSIPSSYKLGDDEDKYTAKDWIFLCSDGKLYNGLGQSLNTDIRSISERGDSIVAYKAPENPDGNPEIYNEYVVYSKNASFSISSETYDLSSVTYYNNLAVVKLGGEETYAVYDMNTGSKTECTAVQIGMNDEVLVLGVDTSYVYIDTDTGSTLCTLDTLVTDWYNGMSGVIGIYKADTETTELHFVASGKNEVTMTLAADESVAQIFEDNKGNASYMLTKVTNVNDPANLDPAAAPIYTITKKAVYTPFVGKTPYYDDMRYFKVFSEGAGIVLAVDYDALKYEFIDLFTGKSIKTVAFSDSENMALTSVVYNSRETLFNNYDDGIELAVFKTVTGDANNDTVKTEYYAFSRRQAMQGTDSQRQIKEYAISPLFVTELGRDINDGIESGVSKYMIVQHNAWSADIYELQSDYTLEKVSNIPYMVSTVPFGNDLEDVYFRAYNGFTEEYALYNLVGEMILGFHSSISVADEEYIIASRQGMYGAYKYDAEKNRVKQILDFEFATVEYAGDGGFITCDAVDRQYGVNVGDRYLYDGKKTANSDPISNMFIQVNYSVDEESGDLMYAIYDYYNFGGELYVHRGEAERMVDRTVIGDTDYSYSSSSYNSFKPTVIVYRDTDGTVISSATVYPTAKSLYEFKLDDTSVWYSVSTEALQKQQAPVTGAALTTAIAEAMATDIYNGGIINVYKAHESITTP